MTQTGITRVVALGLFVLLDLSGGTACWAGEDDSLEVVKPSDALAVELLPAIGGWRQSVGEHDNERIVDYALPEFRDVVARDLTSEASNLHKALFSGATALAPFFKRNLLWTVIRHRQFENAGRGSTVCYYDPEVLEAKLQTGVALIQIQDPHAVRCFFVFFADSRWFVSFAFAYDD